MFGKVGRPREDRVRRRLEIWGTVAPLIEGYGARKLTMRQVAAASLMSVGGLYHYFPNKLALVLYGLDVEPIEAMCADFKARSGRSQEVSPDEVIEEFVELFADITFFKRAAMQAALELGTEESRSRLEGHIKLPAFEAFVGTLRLAMPAADDGEIRVVAKALRQLSFACVLDKSTTREDLERELRIVLRAVPAGQRRTGLAAGG